MPSYAPFLECRTMRGWRTHQQRFACSKISLTDLDRRLLDEDNVLDFFDVKLDSVRLVKREEARCLS